MQQLKRLIRSTIRWAWFGLLVLVAFAFLASGLSEGLRKPSGDDPSVSLASLDVVKGDTEPEVSTADKSVDVTPAADTSAETVAAESGQSFEVSKAIERVNSRWRDSIAAQELEVAPIADWMTIGRRISLALVGSGMSLEEIRKLEALPEEVRNSRYLESLLVDRRFHDYWAERYTRFLVGTDDGPFIVYRRRRFRTWLSDQFEANRRYDDLVRNLVTAEGLWTDQPEVNFLTVTYDSGDGKPDPIRLAARTSRAFLGLRIDCLQCHDDFLGNVSLGSVDDPREGVQQDFHQLAAFYTAAKANGLQGIRGGEVDYDYKYLHDEELTDVPAMVPYSPELLPEEGDPRQRLATWITHPENRQAARAAVSHVWALVFGRAAGDAVDDLPLGQPSTPMIEALTDEFVAANYDLRQLIRIIVGSDAFRVESRAGFEVRTEHEHANAVFPLTRLRPEQTAGSVIQSARIKSVDEDSSLLLQLMKFGTTNDFLKQYGDVGEDEFGDESVTITQRLVMLNGKMVDEHTDNNPVMNASSHIRMFTADNAQAIETTYLTILNRYPNEHERQHFLERFEEKAQLQKSIEDLCWILINSSEFSWNH